MKYAILTLWVISVLILLSQSVTAFDELPDFIEHKSEMMPKAKFLGIVYGTAVTFNLFFAAAPLLMAFYPAKMMDIFMKKREAYWLETPDRTKEAISKMTSGLLWFGCVINSIFWYIMHLTTSAVREGERQPISAAVIIMILAGFAVGIAYNAIAFKVPQK